MKIILYTFLYLHIFRVSRSIEHTAFTISIAENGERKTERNEEEEREKEKKEAEEEEEIEAVPMTEQVMDPNIKITDVPDVEEATEDWDANWDKNKVVRDVAYYIRAHKFQDYDRRYYRKLEDATTRLYEEFPKPPLRSLHWEVRRNCDASFVECLKYLERIITLAALKREDDTVTIMKEQEWNLANNAKQIQAAQKDCQVAQKRDDLTALPFQGPIERFQWRTTVSYYMCWYTMLGVPELSIFGETCDNHANCQVKFGTGNQDPRADDTKPYACAIYSFCPDHCCPMKHIPDMTDCHQSPLNPCYAGNKPVNRECTLNRDDNRDFLSLLSNQINITCQCEEAGYEWSPMFGLCIDINECTRGEHGCSTEEGETCMNLPGGFECVCKFGYVYDAERRECTFNSELEELLSEEKESNETDRRSTIEKIVQAITKSSCSRHVTDYAIVFAVLLAEFLLVEEIG